MKAALLLIDLQQDFLRADGLTPPAGAIVANAARLLSDWRAAGRTVVHIWTTVQRDDDRRMPHWRKHEIWSCVEGTEGHATPARLQPRDGEVVIHKTFFSGFSTGELESYLRKTGIEKVVLAGVHTHGCIRSTTLAAYEKGFEVVIAADAIGGYDAIHGTISEYYLDGRAGVFLDSDEIESGGDLAENTAELPAKFSLARTAFSQWQNVTLAQRRSVLLSLADQLAQHAGEFAAILVEDIGKPITLARAEVQRAIDLLLTVGRGATDERPTPLTTGWRRVPLGVVALISPFNNPLAIPIGKLAPALLHGNVVVWKPAIPGSRIATRTAELLAETGLTPGALQVVLGGKRTARECMSRADAVTLSGSPEAGRSAQLICARQCLPLQAELGGNNAAIVWHDSDLTQAAAAVADGAFAFAGQRCTANRRVIVDAAIYLEFLEHLKALLAAFAPLNPMEPSSRLGPLISVRSRQRLEALLERAADAGCEIFSLPTTQPGAWMNPAIVCAPDPALEIVQEESFGPILVVQKAVTWEHALELCNRVRQGLAAACFTNDPARIDDFLRNIRCGILKLNRSTADADVDLPFGGWKTSGLGPAEHGPANVEFFTRMQAIYR